MIHPEGHYWLTDSLVGVRTQIRPFAVVRSCSIAHDVKIYERVTLKRCTVHAEAAINVGTYAELVHIGANVQIGPNCSLVGVWHPVGEHGAEKENVFAEIKIGERALLGAGVIVVPGVSIGTRAVVGAGTVVTRDIPPNVIVYGNGSARVQMSLEEYASARRTTNRG